MTLKGHVFDISRACVDDGPGLRTVIFMKGCALDCPWCHNPEGKSFKAVIAFDGSRCIACGRCMETCSRSWPDPNQWRDGCTACGACAESCPSGARRMAGREYTEGELVEEATKDADFYAGTGGGVTFSGGEPMLSAEFVFACAEKLQARDIHCALETAGHWPEKLAGDIKRHFNLVLFDLKHVRKGKFKRIVGRDNSLVLKNLKRLDALGIPMELRLTVVPGFNDGAEDLKEIIAWLDTLATKPPIRLQPFHRLATAKENLYGKAYPYADVEPLPASRLDEAADLLKSSGFNVIMGA